MDGLTEGGKRLLDSILSKGSNCTIDQKIISQCLDANGMLPERWEPSYFVSGVHITDHEQGVTLDDYKLIKSILMVTNQWEVGMTEGLTKGGKRLLKAILKHDSYAVLCADVIEDFLRDQKHAKTVWYHKNGVHALDADNGVTYDDYKLIKSILMVTNQWEF